MTGQEDHIKSIRKAGKKRGRAQQQLRQAADELRVVCTQAVYAGVPVTEIAAAAGLSRQGVYDLVGEQAFQARRQNRGA